jgi:hypothetical protein
LGHEISGFGTAYVRYQVIFRTNVRAFRTVQKTLGEQDTYFAPSCIGRGLRRLSTPRGAGWEPITSLGISRAKKSHCWSGCWGCCGCVEALSTAAQQDTWPQPNRGLPAKWVSKPPDERLTCVESRPLKSYSLRLQSHGLGHSIGHLLDGYRSRDSQATSSSTGPSGAS